MKKSAVALTIFLISFAVYISTLTPSVAFTDSGELAGACASLGVAHPTGYPLFVMIGHLWTLLPLPFSIIYKLNLFAAFCTALSSSIFFLLCVELLRFVSLPFAIKTRAKKINKQRVPITAEKAIESVDPSSQPRYKVLLFTVSASAALCYAFAQTVWLQATSIEVYSLHLLMMMLILYFTVVGVVTSSKLLTITAAICLGLSFSNHLTTILLVPPIALLFFFRPRETFNFSKKRRLEFALLLGIVLCCAAVYLYMPLRSAGKPWFNWGAVHRGWEQFSYHAFGKQYSVWMFSGEHGAVAKQFKVFFGLLPYNLAFVGIVAMIWGGISLARKNHLRPLLSFFLLMVFFGVGYSVNYNIHDIDSYFLSAYAALLLLMAIGIYDLLLRTPRYAAVAFVLPVIALSINWKYCDEHDNELVHEYVKMMVDPLPQNSLLISQQWDYFCSAFWYMQQVEGYRPDVVLVEKELLRRTWFPQQLQRWYPEAIERCKTEIDSYMVDLRDFEQDAEEFKKSQARTIIIQNKFVKMLNAIVSRNMESRHVFVTQEVFQGESGFSEGLVKTPFGLTIQLSKGSPAPTVDTNTIRCDSFIASVHRHHENHLEKGIAESASRELTNNCTYLLEMKKSEDAEWFCRQALLIDSRNTAASELLRRIIDGKKR